MDDLSGRAAARQIPIGSYGPPLLRRTIQLPLDQLRSHIHVIGTSGSGKSRFLAGLILNLIEQPPGADLDRSPRRSGPSGPRPARLSWTTFNDA